MSEAIPLAAGIRLARWSSVVAFSEMARLTPSGGISFNRAARPAVETVMRLGDHPSPHGLLVSRRIASDKASMLPKGSPIPIKTRLVIRSLGSRRSWAVSTCSMISNGFKLRFNPIVPVRQNPQSRVQPTCVDTQRVKRSSSGISTVSTVSPSLSVSTSFLV